MYIPIPDINIQINANTSLEALYPEITVIITNVFGAGETYYNVEAEFYTLDGTKILITYSGDFKENSKTVTLKQGVDPIYNNQETILISVSAYTKYSSYYSDMTVAELTESSKLSKYSIVTVFKKDIFNTAYLKAIMNIPTESTLNYVATWEKTTDGKTYTGVYPTDEEEGLLIPVRVVKEEFTDYDLEKLDSNSYKTVMFKNFSIPNKKFSEFDTIIDRPDVLKIPTDSDFVNNDSYRFKIVTLKTITNEDIAWDTDGPTTQYKQDLVLGQYLYTPVFADEFEFPYNTFGNSVMGNKLYSRKAVYSYGHPEFKNNIFISEAGSFITPLLNAADLDTQDDSEVTAVLPWRDYVIASTEKALYILTKQENGFLIKTVSTAIGIPAKDKDTCKSILNGLIFKSGNKIYTLYPNMYSSDDSMLNMGDISKPIENILLENVPHEAYNSFAISTETEYILLIPQKYSDTNPETFCYKYNYSRKMWTFSTYPAIINDYEMFSVDDIRLFGYSYKDDVKTYSEYIYGKDLKEAYPEIDITNIPYGDILTSVVSVPSDMETWGTEADVTSIKPIEFMFDSGQRTNNISFTKQFTETKFIVATEHEKDSFPFEINVFIDGNQFPHKTDISTDAGFWRNSSNQNLVLGGAAQPDSAVKTLRQVFFRYSGKGKSIRHVVKGKSLYKFKIYEIYYRFKNLNVKQ